MVREFVSYCETDSIRMTIWSDYIYAGDFVFFSAIFGETWNIKWLAVRAQNATVAFIKPFRRSPDVAGRRASTLHTPAKHLHAIGEICVSRSVHGLPILRAAKVGQSC